MAIETVSFAGGRVALVREGDVRAHLRAADAVADLRDAFAQHAVGRADSLPRLRVEAPRTSRGSERPPRRAWLHTLRARLDAPAVVGGKDYTSLGFDVPASWCTLIDDECGLPVAFIEADRLSRVRTAAGTALATDLLAPRDAVRLGHVGAGKISEPLVRAILEVRPSIQEVLLARRQEDPPPWLADLGVRARLASPREVLEACDVVTTATSSREPVLPDEPAPSGLRHLNLVGSNHPRRAEIGPHLGRSLLPAAGGFLCVEDPEQAAQEDGDFRILVEEEELYWGGVPSLGALLTDPPTAEEARAATRTTFASHGIGLMDLAVAAGLARRLGVLSG